MLLCSLARLAEPPAQPFRTPGATRATSLGRTLEARGALGRLRSNFFFDTKAVSRPRSHPGERSGRVRSLSDRMQKQRGKTPRLAAMRGHTTALGHLGCHKNRVMAPCFGRRARRAAHVSDPRRWKEVNPKGVTAAARRCRASLLTRAQPGRRSSPPGRQERPVRRAGAEPSKLGTLGTAAFKFFFSLQGSQVSAGVRDGVKLAARGILGQKKLPQSQITCLPACLHGVDKNRAPAPTSPRGRDRTRLGRGRRRSAALGSLPVFQIAAADSQTRNPPRFAAHLQGKSPGPR